MLAGQYSRLTCSVAWYVQVRREHDRKGFFSVEKVFSQPGLLIDATSLT